MIDHHSPSQPTLTLGLALAAAGLFAVAATVAQPPASQPGRPGAGSSDAVEFEVVSLDERTWSVTARDVETGETLRFKLPPKAFVGQRFTADLGGTAPGQKVTVQAPPGARIEQAVVESPLGTGLGRSGLSNDRYERQERRPPGPTGFGDRQRDRNRSRHPGARSSGPMEYEILSVDQRTWTVTARGSDGETVTLEISPEAFIGFRFSAPVSDLQAGQGFALMATNERPLLDCCRVKSSLGR